MSMKNLKIGMNMSLSGKIISLIGASVLGVCVATIVATYILLSGTFNELGRKEMAADIDVVQGQLDQMASRVSATAILIADNPAIVKAVGEKDAGYLKQFGKEFMKRGGGGVFVTFTDRNGNVIARGHSDKTGDSILRQINIQKALAGETTFGIEEGTEIKFSLRAGSPVKNGGTIVGAVSTGIDLSSSHSFVDEIKKTLDAECVIFLGDTGVSTSILKDGKRAVGTKMDNPRVIETVLQKGGKFYEVNRVLGKDFDTAYWPITGADKKIAGMFFIGKDREIKMKGLSQAILFTVLSAFVVGAILTAAAFFVTRSMTRHLKVGVEFAKGMAAGDLTQTIEVKQKDEIGVLAEALNDMAAHIRSMFRDISGGVQTLTSASKELSAVSDQTASGVRNVSEKAATVATSAEEMSANTVSVAVSMEEASTNLASVASATEEMSATVAEIASNSEKARAISEQATAQAQTISELMLQLGQAAREIGKVTETITDISSQTNLLALNATIEAARAGAAGKGFAVVANEIKELARQTAEATEDIKTKIAGVQTSAGSAITDIEKIAGVIKDVGSIVASIAAAIEEQAAVTRDVAGNIAQASLGVKEANERVAQTASVSQSIAHDISGVNTAVGEIRQGGEQVQASAAELSRLSEQLRALVSRFTI
jgi:methyl-accepting chemotaxis protein